ncbi:MAG: RluA family pseudouridine synthase [bacterium]
MTFQVEEDNSGIRLDLFLAHSQNTYTRSSVKSHINAGKVLVNQAVEFKPNYRVKIGDQIVVDFEISKAGEIIAQDIPLDIIYEDSDLLVINKPVGQVVHPATGNWQNTLVNALVFHFKEMEKVGENIRSGLIHRLDKDTSGLVLIGKTNKGLWYYSKLFAERKVVKTYLAVVLGNVKERFPSGKFSIENYLGRNPIKRKKFTVVSAEKGKLAETDFILQNLINVNGRICSILEVSPRTGRTHQIRVHLSKSGYPILGDQIYGRTKFPRLMLHAWKIEVLLMTGKMKEFIAPIPEEFKFN